MVQLKPLVTIAIPTFNRVGSLKQCIAFALGQSYDNFEVIVSDNASEDGTLELLQSMRDPRLRVKRQQQNIGLFPNFNACLREAKGEYVVFLSDDDEIEPWFLEQCMLLTDRHRKLPIIVTNSRIRMATENLLFSDGLHPRLRTGIYDGPTLMLEYLKSTLSIQMCGVLLRTETVRAAGGFPTNHPFAGDVATWGPILISGQAGFVSRHCATYTHHSGNETWKFTFQSRANDVDTVLETICAVAEKTVKDEYISWQISMAARRYLIMVVIKHVAACRRAGAGVLKALSLLWQFRRFARRCRPVDYLAIFGSRSTAHILLPRPLIRLLTRLRNLRHAQSGELRNR